MLGPTAARFIRYRVARRAVYHRRSVLVLATAGLAGCGFRSGASPTGTATPETTEPLSAGTVRTTHLDPSGNRLADGTGGLPEADPLDVTLDLDAPRWVVAVPSGDGGASYWVAVDEAGAAVAHRVDAGGATSVPMTADLRPGQPPTVRAGPDGPVVPAPPPDLSRFSHPLPLRDRGRTYIADDGALVLVNPERPRRLNVAAPPDAYPVLDPGGADRGARVVVLAGATDRYGHGALGDPIEADGFAVVDPDAAAVETRVSVPGAAVVEGQAPILADLTGDGTPAVVVTESDGNRGARIAAYSLSGDRLAAGPPVGSGYRWRHQLAVAPFGPDGRAEVAAVETPHIGGTGEFYRRDGDRLRLAGRVEGVSSHAIGSRILDGAVAGDADGDGRVELVVPDDARRQLVGLRRTEDGAKAGWRVPVGGDVASNLHAVTVDGRLVVGVARADGVLRVWR